MRRVLLLFVIPVLICAGWADDSAREGSATTVEKPSPVAAQVPPRSCLWYRSKIRWCLNGWEGDEWDISVYEGRKHAGRYYVHNHRDEVLGYLRPTHYGWRAMVSVCPAGSRPCGWARGGKVVRLPGRQNVYYVYSEGNPRGVQGCVFSRCGGGPRREVARGPDAIAVAAYKLVKGDCDDGFCE